MFRHNPCELKVKYRPALSPPLPGKTKLSINAPVTPLYRKTLFVARLLT